MLEIKLWVPDEVLSFPKQAELLRQLHSSRGEDAEKTIIKFLPNMKYSLFNVTHAVDNIEETNVIILEVKGISK